MRGSAVCASLGLGPLLGHGGQGKGAPGEGVRREAGQQGAHPTGRWGGVWGCRSCGGPSPLPSLPAEGPARRVGGVGWGPLPLPGSRLLSAVCDLSHVLGAGETAWCSQPWGGLAGPRRRKPAAGGETVTRWVSALSRRPGAAGPHLELLGGSGMCPWGPRARPPQL